MNYASYLQLFDEILEQRYTEAPYHQQSYVDYVKLNQTRSKRWQKTGRLQEELKSALRNVTKPLNWILITEPWCGDSAHIAPFLHQMAQENDLIKLEIQLRDKNSEIEQYLTNGSRSIPLLVMRDDQGKDLAVWGARPEALKKYRMQMVEEGQNGTELSLKIQQWYNDDKGMSFQQEVMDILKKLNTHD